MKIFISWSGEPSRTVARTLRHWLPDVIQSVEPWMSELDLEAGARWNEKIQRELSETRFGILCVTPQNIGAPWLLFEAGALAKTLQDTYVCPYLIGIEPSALPQGPLTQFQAKRANQAESRDLIMTVNRALGDEALDPARVERGFDRCWPDLERAFTSLPKPEASTTLTPQRTPEEMLEEILLLVRNIERQERSPIYLQFRGDQSPRFEIASTAEREGLNPICLSPLDNLRIHEVERINDLYDRLGNYLAPTTRVKVRSIKSDAIESTKRDQESDS